MHNLEQLEQTLESGDLSSIRGMIKDLHVAINDIEDEISAGEYPDRADNEDAHFRIEHLHDEIKDLKKKANKIEPGSYQEAKEKLPKASFSAETGPEEDEEGNGVIKTKVWGTLNWGGKKHKAYFAYSDEAGLEHRITPPLKDADMYDNELEHELLNAIMMKALKV